MPPHVPAVFTPDNEPYLGRQALLTFDGEIPFSLWVSLHWGRTCVLQYRTHFDNL